MKYPRLTFESPVDNDGRRAFTIEWESYPREEVVRGAVRVSSKRGQCFRAVPDSYVKQVLDGGGEVVECQ